MASKTIEDLHKVATKSRVESISQIAKGFAVSFEKNEGYKTFLNWTKTLKNSSSLALTEEEKRVLRGLLDELLQLHESGSCHGNLDVSSVLISDTSVKLVNMQFISYEYIYATNDYHALARLIRLFRQRLPKDVQHLVNYLEGSSITSFKNPICIFNHPCTWDTNQVCMAIEYLDNRRNRHLDGRHLSTMNKALDYASEGDWQSRIRKSILKDNLEGAGTCLLKFMRDTYDHPPFLPKRRTPLNQVEIADAFYEKCPTFMCKLIEKLVEDQFVKRGDFLDMKYIGTKNFCSARNQY